MVEPILAWVGFALMLLFCLPVAGLRKLLLELSALVLRLALLAVLAGAAVLWFRPDLLPSEVVGVVEPFPRVRSLLPEPGSQTFGLALAALVVAPLLPCLAMLDVTRKLAGRHLRILRRLVHATQTAPATSASVPAPVVVEAPIAESRHPQPVVPPQRRPDRRAAADTIGDLGSRKPYRVADHLS